MIRPLLPPKRKGDMYAELTHISHIVLRILEKNYAKWTERDFNKEQRREADKEGKGDTA